MIETQNSTVSLLGEWAYKCPKDSGLHEVILIRTLAAAYPDEQQPPHHRLLLASFSFSDVGHPLMMTPRYDGNLVDLPQPLDHDRLADLIDDIGRAIAHMHQASILHCDIKPQNILFRTNGTSTTFVLTDFGSAFIDVDDSLEAENAINNTTIPYRAPETWLANPHYTPKCDAWSFGAVIFFCQHGRLLLGAPRPATYLEVTNRLGTALRNYQGNCLLVIDPSKRPAVLDLDWDLRPVTGRLATASEYAAMIGPSEHAPFIAAEMFGLPLIDDDNFDSRPILSALPPAWVTDQKKN